MSGSLVQSKVHVASSQRDAVADGPARATRVMLVDDSIVVRSIIERIIENAGQFEIVASVPTALEAMESLRHLAVDIIVLDLEMPGMHGLAAIPLMLARAPDARIIILSANCEDGGPAAVEALALGAADTMLKPGRGTFAGQFGTLLIERLRGLAASEKRPEPIARRDTVIASPRPVIAARRIDVIGIGASTGGIMAINGFLAALPEHMTAPILITQHLPAGFIRYFAEQLQRVSTRRVLVGEDGLAVVPGCIYVAPGEAHMRVVRMTAGVHMMLDHMPAPSGATPSVDPMMASLAECYGAAACVVMLSGMGRDGADGARMVKRAGGLVVAQDVASSVVWGMPGAIARDGLTEALAEPAMLAELIGQAALSGPFA